MRLFRAVGTNLCCGLIALASFSCGSDERARNQVLPCMNVSGRTAYEQLKAAERYLGRYNYSAAYRSYEAAIALLADADPCNDGPVSDMDLYKAYYGATLTQISIPLGIIDEFISGLFRRGGSEVGLAGSAATLMAQGLRTLSSLAVHHYQMTAQPENTNQLPVSLITDYVREMILPPLMLADSRLEHIMKLEDFAYELPPLKLSFLGSIVSIPGRTPTGMADHDRGEVYFLAALVHLAKALCHMVLSVNLNLDASRIDDILEIILGGDPKRLMELLDTYPELLTVNTIEASGIDGNEELRQAKADLIEGLECISSQKADLAGVRADLFRTVVEENDNQQDDIIRWLDRGTPYGLSINSAINGAPVEQPLVNAVLRVLFAFLQSERIEEVRAALYGTYPPEQDMVQGVRNGIDDDNDGYIDDGPLDISMLLSLLQGKSDLPRGSKLGLLLNAVFDTAPDIRSLLPAWDVKQADPAMWYFVVDRSEDFEDRNRNGRYEPGIDILHDAAHGYGSYRYPPDGHYEPAYLYFTDPTFSGTLWFWGALEAMHPNDSLNLILGSMLGASRGAVDTQARHEQRNARKSAEEWSFPTVFPRSGQPRHLWVLSAYEAPLEMKLMLASLQGLVNRSLPRVYLLYSNLEFNPTWDHEEKWLSYMHTHYGVTWEVVESPWRLLEMCRDEIKGAVVYDPELPGSINVATALSGLHGALVVHPDLVAAVRSYGIPVIADVRGRWNGNVDMYRWAFENLWPHMNHKVLAFIQSTLPVMRDYLIANNIFCVDLNYHIPEERALLERILAETPRNIPILGWAIDELIGVATFSNYGKFHVASDHVPNLSVHSGLPAKEYRQYRIPEQVDLENIIYVSFGYTDGDSLSFTNRWARYCWDDPARGSIPLAWQLAPALLDVAPDVLDYYYSSASPNDLFVSPVSGIGYMYPNLYPDLDRFLEITLPYYRRLDFSIQWLLNNDMTFPDEILTRYTDVLGPQGFLLDYWSTADLGYDYTSQGVPMVRSQYIYLLGGPEQVEAVLKEKKAQKPFVAPDRPMFVFVGVNGWKVLPTHLKNITASLGEGYKVVRIDTLFQLMVDAYVYPCPGTQGSVDTDGDRVGDQCDNCPYEFNYEQADNDLDHIGDRCDPDDDNDGIVDIDDNCPFVYNPDQADIDKDGLGDRCDPISFGACMQSPAGRSSQLGTPFRDDGVPLDWIVLFLPAIVVRVRIALRLRTVRRQAALHMAAVSIHDRGDAYLL